MNEHRKQLFVATIFDNHPYFEDIPSSRPALPPSVWQSVTAIALLFHGNVVKPLPAEQKVLRARLLGAKQHAIQNLVSEISVERENTSYFTISSINCLAQTDVSCMKHALFRWTLI